MRGSGVFVEDELEAVPGVVEEDVEGGAEGGEGGAAGEGEVGGVGGVFLAEELGAFADAAGVAEEGAEAEGEDAEGKVDDEHPEDVGAGILGGMGFEGVGGGGGDDGDEGHPRVEGGGGEAFAPGAGAFAEAAAQEHGAEEGQEGDESHAEEDHGHDAPGGLVEHERDGQREHGADAEGAEQEAGGGEGDAAAEEADDDGGGAGGGGDGGEEGGLGEAFGDAAEEEAAPCGEGHGDVGDDEEGVEGNEGAAGVFHAQEDHREHVDEAPGHQRFERGQSGAEPAGGKADDEQNGAEHGRGRGMGGGLLPPLAFGRAGDRGRGRRREVVALGFRGGGEGEIGDAGEAAGIDHAHEFAVGGAGVGADDDGLAGEVVGDLAEELFEGFAAEGALVDGDGAILRDVEDDLAGEARGRLGRLGGGKGEIHLIFPLGEDGGGDEEAEQEEDDVHHGRHLELRKLLAMSAEIHGSLLRVLAAKDGDQLGGGTFKLGHELGRAAAEKGVKGHRRNGHEEAEDGGDDGLGDALGQEGGLGGGDVGGHGAEGLQHANHGAKEADHGRDGRDVQQPLGLALDEVGLPGAFALGDFGNEGGVGLGGVAHGVEGRQKDGGQGRGDVFAEAAGLAGVIGHQILGEVAAEALGRDGAGAEGGQEVEAHRHHGHAHGQQHPHQPSAIRPCLGERHLRSGGGKQRRNHNLFLSSGEL